MNTIKRFLSANKKRIVILLIILVLVAIGAYAWHKHQQDALNIQRTSTYTIQPNLDLDTINPSNMSVAFISKYASLKGVPEQQQKLVSLYGTQSLIDSYKPVKDLQNADPFLCSNKGVIGVSAIGSIPYNKNRIYTLSLAYTDGKKTSLDVEMTSQSNGFKIVNVACPINHTNAKTGTVPGKPGGPDIKIGP